MYWFDWMTLGIVVVVTLVETLRSMKAGGMGQAIFDGAGLVVAAVAATTFAKPLSLLVGIEKWIVMLVIFGVLGIGAFILGRYLFNLTQWSFQSMDGVFSAIGGLVGAWAIGHMVLRIIIEKQGGMTGAVGALLQNAVVAREVYFFNGWNWLVHLLFRARLGPDFNPDVG